MVEATEEVGSPAMEMAAVEKAAGATAVGAKAAARAAVAGSVVVVVARAAQGSRRAS